VLKILKNSLKKLYLYVYKNKKLLKYNNNILMEITYLILYTIVSLLLFWLIIKWGSSLVVNKLCLKEGLTELENYSYKVIPYPQDALINYNDTNSPLYSHIVNLPINDPVSCKNFCGPQSQCAITREQCTSDIDCAGCNPGPTPLSKCETKEVDPYDDTGKLGQNQGLQYSSLTTGYNGHGMDFEEVYPGSKEAEIQLPYQGVDLWTESFNEGLKLYNKQRESDDKFNDGLFKGIIDTSNGKLAYYKNNYPMTVSTTGLFYQTTPPASNSSLT